MRKAVASAVILASGVLTGCAGDSRDAAMRYERASIAGDIVQRIAMLSRSDSAALASPDAAELRKSMTAPESGSPATRADSARIVHETRDSARVTVYLTGPNWQVIGGRFAFTGTETKDRAESLGLAERLPRITTIDTVTLVRERSGLHTRWALAFGLAEQIRIERVLGPLRRMAFASDSPLVVRAEAMRQYVSLAKREGVALASYLIDDTASVFATAPLVDSLPFTLRAEASQWPIALAGMPTRDLVGWVENRSHLPIERIVVRARFASGETGDAWAYNVAPGARERFVGPGNWKGQVIRSYITEIKVANGR